MTEVLDYINTHNLSCKTWLNGVFNTNFIVSGSSFTWLNSIGNTNYDFIQSDNTLFPSLLDNGVTFSGDQRLYPRNNNLLVDAESYTTIFVTQGNTYGNDSIISWKKSNTLMPSLLEYRYQANQLKQQFSLLNIANEISGEEFSGAYQTLGVNHNIRYGYSRYNLNQTGFIERFNSDRGSLLEDYFGQFFLGNSGSANPFTGSLLHLLMFVPEILETHVNNIIEMLPLENDYEWDELSELKWNNLTESAWNLVS